MVNYLMDHPMLKGRQDVPPPEIFLTADRRALWLAPSYHLRKWDVQGTPLASLDITSSPWVPPSVWRDTVTSGGRGGVKPSYVRQSGGFATLIGVDGSERLWMLVSTVVRGQPPRQRLEILTPKGGVLLSQPIEKPFRLIAPDVVAEESQDADGLVSIILSRITLMRK
jgi:hypothetical protein